MKQSVSERIKLLRTAARKTQIEFAADLDLSISIVSKIESGDQPASSKVLDKIIDVYSVPEKWLLKGEGEMSFKSPEKNITTPWKDEAYALLKDRLAKQDVIIDRLTQALLGKASFPLALNRTGARKKALLGAAA